MALDQSTVNAAGLGGSLSGDFAARKAQRAALLTKRDEASTNLDKATGEVADIQTKTAADQAPVYQQLADFKPRKSAMPTPEPPGEFKPTEISPADLQKNAGMILAVAGLLGAFSRGGMITTLTSLTGAMEGFQQGSAERAQKELDTYKLGMSNFKTKVDALKKDRDELDKMDQRDVDALRRQLELVAHKHDAELVGAKAKVASYLDARKELDSQIKEMDRLVTSSDRIESSLTKHLSAHAASTGGGAGGGGGPGASMPHDDLVDALGQGRLLPADLGRMKQDERLRLLQEVMQKYPDFDRSVGVSKTAVRRDFTSGTTANNITAISTAIGHMSTMRELGDAMKNNDLKSVNALVNRLATETGHPEVTNFETARDAVASELMRVFRQVGASEVETQHWKDRFSASSSPQQLHEAIKTGADLLKSRIDAINERWDRGMGTKGGMPGMLSPKTLNALRAMGVGGQSPANDAPEIPSGWTVKKH